MDRTQRTRRTIASLFPIRFWKRFSCRLIQARPLFPTSVISTATMPAITVTPGPMPSPQTWPPFLKAHPKGILISKPEYDCAGEIYAMGDSRDVNESIEKFLGRKQSVQPFLKKIGIGEASAPSAPSLESK